MLQDVKMATERFVAGRKVRAKLIQTKSKSKPAKSQINRYSENMLHDTKAAHFTMNQHTHKPKLTNGLTKNL